MGEIWSRLNSHHLEYLQDHRRARHGKGDLEVLNLAGEQPQIEVTVYRESAHNNVVWFVDALDLILIRNTLTEMKLEDPRITHGPKCT